MNVDGHFAPAASKFAAAIEAARALGPAAGEGDCLVVASLQLYQADALAALTNIRSLPTLEREEALRQAFFTLLPAARQTLLRRKAAGTLLGGTCRPHEVAWQAAIRKYMAELSRSPSDWSNLALHVGYDAFLCAAHCTFNLLRSHEAAKLSAAELYAHAMFVCDALTLMAAPRRGRTGSPALTSADVSWSGNEASMLHTMQRLVADNAITDGCGGPEILAAWRALQQSGALEERHLLIDGAATACRTDSCPRGTRGACCRKSCRSSGADARVRAGQLRRARGVCGAAQAVRRLRRGGVLLQGAPGGGLACAQGGLQGGARSQGRREAALR